MKAFPRPHPATHSTKVGLWTCACGRFSLYTRRNMSGTDVNHTRRLNYLSWSILFD